jgi:hypothetical protein
LKNLAITAELNRLSEILKRHGMSLSDLPRILFPALFIIPRIPLTVARVFRLYVETLQQGVRGILGVTPRYCPIPTWYLRIGEYVKTVGKRGYVLEEGLGIALGEQLHVEPIANRVYQRLMVLYPVFAALCFLAATVGVGILAGRSWWQLLLTAGVMLGSSTFLFGFLEKCKPEGLAWGFFFISLYAFLAGAYPLATAALFLVACLNLTVFTLISVSLVTMIITLSGRFIPFLVVMTPAVLIRAYWSAPFVFNIKDYLRLLHHAVTAEEVYEDHFQFGLPEIYETCLFATPLIALWLSGSTSLTMSVLLLIPVALQVINKTSFRFADRDTLQRYTAAMTTMILLTHFNVWTFLAWVLVMHITPPSFHTGARGYGDYPWFELCSTAAADRLTVGFFKSVPDGRRVGTECRSIKKRFDGFRHVLFSYFTNAMNRRRIEILPGETMRGTAPQYFAEKYTRLNEMSSIEEIISICDDLGLQMLICWTPALIEKLTVNGFSAVARLPYADIQSAFWHNAMIPAMDLVLMQPPTAFNLVTHTDYPLLKRDDQLVLVGRAGALHTVKYCYHRSWRAYQNGKPIKITRADGSLPFMQVEAITDGEITLRFEPHWLWG